MERVKLRLDLYLIFAKYYGIRYPKGSLQWSTQTF